MSAPKSLTERVEQELSDLLPGHSPDDYHIAALCAIASVSIDGFLKTVSRPVRAARTKESTTC